LRTLGDYWQLTRPRIVVMVLFAMAVAARSAGEQPPPGHVLMHALLGAALVIVGAVALNQRLERLGDAKMLRTVRRPLPSGRLADRQVTLFGSLTSAAGFGYLTWWSTGSVVALAGVSWVIYVWTYTPLKSVTVWQTPIGALAGAMPILLGAAAAGATFSPMALALFGIVFFWQIPHAMAIAWLYRRQFAQAGVRLLPVVEPSGRAAGAIALLAAAALPLCALGLHEGFAATGAVALLGLVQLIATVRFAVDRTDARARQLLCASMLYLPGVLLVLLALGAPG